MKPAHADDLRRLHFIDALFTQVTGHDLYLAQQIKDAITFSLAELEARTREDPESAARYDAAFTAAAADLLVKFFGNNPGYGFYHWDAATTLVSATPLFTRAEIMTGLRHLARFREATLLITNLRPALLPLDRRQSARRKRDYQEALAFIQTLTAARTSTRSNLQLLFL